MGANLPSKRSRRGRTPMAEINVTPLVDVMLVLLIIFMVTAPLLNAGVPVELPDSNAKPLAQEPALASTPAAVSAVTPVAAPPPAIPHGVTSSPTATAAA